MNNCSLCKKPNDGEWVILTSKGSRMKVCKECSEVKADNPPDFNFYEQNKKRVEEERKLKNAEIIRDLKRTKPAGNK